MGLNLALDVPVFKLLDHCHVQVMVAVFFNLT